MILDMWEESLLRRFLYVCVIGVMDGLNRKDSFDYQGYATPQERGQGFLNRRRGELLSLLFRGYINVECGNETNNCNYFFTQRRTYVSSLCMINYDTALPQIRGGALVSQMQL